VRNDGDGDDDDDEKAEVDAAPLLSPRALSVADTTVTAVAATNAATSVGGGVGVAPERAGASIGFDGGPAALRPSPPTPPPATEAAGLLNRITERIERWRSGETLEEGKDGSVAAEQSIEKSSFSV